MQFSEIYSGKKLAISFEIFPPKTQKGEENLFRALSKLVDFSPSFISVTYGAGGSTRVKSLDLAKKIRREFSATVVPHYTCVGSSQKEILLYLDELEAEGFTNILALRGDPPKGEDHFVQSEDGFKYANELVAFIRTKTFLSIGVAGYPEVHRECSCQNEDLSHLKTKIDAGADVILTQLFYDNNAFFNYKLYAEKIGIKVPIVPGIMPITNLSLIETITETCGASIPNSFHSKLHSLETSKEIRAESIKYSITQCQELIDSDVPGIHFYPLNKSYACSQILSELDY